MIALIIVGIWFVVAVATAPPVARMLARRSTEEDEMIARAREILQKADR